MHLATPACRLFTARPKAQRCHVTPYVVNVLVVVVLVGGGAIAKLMFCQPIEAVHSILSIITFVHLTPLLTLRVGVGGGGLGVIAQYSLY